jgi:ABC-type sugar transport system substrate-binding protein
MSTKLRILLGCTRAALVTAGVLGGVFVLGAFGCGKGEGGPPSTRGQSSNASSDDSHKVAFLLSTLQEERYKKDQRYFEEMARKKGLISFTLSADNDNARQLSQV